MANYCDYMMILKGSKESRDTFFKRATDYNEPKHLFRIFECEVTEEEEDYTVLRGCCAWSIETCCRESGYSNGFDLLAANSEELHLDIEVWSSETEGMFFAEHYIYKNGECLIDETVEIKTFPFWDKDEWPTFEEYLKQNNLTDEDVKEEDFDEDGTFENLSWGFKNWGEITI